MTQPGQGMDQWGTIGSSNELAFINGEECVDQLNENKTLMNAAT